MIQLAGEKGEADLVKLYENAYKMVVNSFHNRYIRDGQFVAGKHCESIFAGQWVAFHLKLGEIWKAEDTDFILSKLENIIILIIVDLDIRKVLMTNGVLIF